MKESILLFIGGLGSLEFLFILFVLLVPAILWLWALIDLLKSNFTDNMNKMIWAIVIIFIPVMGALLYLIIGRNQKIRPSNS